MQRNWLLWSAIVGLVVVLGVLIFDRNSYGDPPWEGDPVQFDCGGRLYAEPFDETRRQLTNFTGTLYPVLRVPPLIGTQVYSVFPSAQRQSAKNAGAARGGSSLIKITGNSF